MICELNIHSLPAAVMLEGPTAGGFSPCQIKGV